MCKCRIKIFKNSNNNIENTNKTVNAVNKNIQSQFKYAAILLMLMTLAAW